MLRKGHVALLRRVELKTFVNFHGNEVGKGGDLTLDETTIITGVLVMTEKTVKDALIPYRRDTLNEIMTMGYSRVPIYYQVPMNIIGLILVSSSIEYPVEFTCSHTKTSVLTRWLEKFQLI